VRREVWRGRPWAGFAMTVVRDEPDELVLYLAEGTAFAFPEGDWPGGRHPWHGRPAWVGHGVLHLHRPGDPYSIWAFWDGPDRRFAGWYVNLQAPFRRSERAIDTLDHELDIWIPEGGGRRWKDEDLLEASVATGRFTREEVAAIRADGKAVLAELDAGRRWWSDEWRTWTPDPAWTVPELPDDWETA
jgi:Protein of unknown function (DUF402)